MISILSFAAIVVMWEASAWWRQKQAHRQKMKRIDSLLEASRNDMKLASEILKSARTKGEQ